MDKITVVPAILEADFLSVQAALAHARAFSGTVQVDIVDGVFAPTTTYGATPNVADYARLADACAGCALELDLMVSLDERVDAWVSVIRASYAQRVVLHFGSSSRLAEVASRLAEMGIVVGCAVHIGDDLDAVHTLLATEHFSFVQVMGIAQVGVQGSAFDDRALDIVRALREAYPHMDIAVDGGVKKENVRALVHAGANRLCIGSAIMKTDNPAVAFADITAYVA